MTSRGGRYAHEALDTGDTGLNRRVWRLVVVSLLLATGGTASANVWFCDGDGNGNPECLCIAWATPQGEKLEMRCPSSGGNPPGGTPPGYIPPTWGGGGTPQNPSSAPGMPLSGITLMNVNNAHNNAKILVAGDYDPDSRFWLPNECTALFNGNKMGVSARGIMDYVVYRSGVGHQDASGNVPCNGGVSAWTTCCTHTKYVFICDSRFNNLPAAERAYYLIHEAMHVGGQLENGTGTVTGPSDPPNSDQITAEVKKACS